MPRSVPVVLTLASLGVLSACRPDTGLTKFNSEPEAQITAPSDGSAVLEGTTVTLRGQASDPNHPTTQLLARWFAGDTEACASTAPAADGTTTCDVLVPDGDALAVRLEVLDPEGSAGTAEASYAITPNQAPLATIASPVADGVYYSDQLVVLRATVDDAEDEASALQVRWESNRDGDLGQATPNSEGLVESFVNLTEGAHAVQVFVTDSAGNEGQATVLVEVGPPNTAPGCGITAPTDGGAGVEGARVDFAGAVTDVDIPADRLSVRWTSDKDGDLGASTPDTAGSVAFSTSALSVNTHRITMTVTDEVGATCTTGLTWTVGTPPEVTLETPLPGEVANEGEGLSFSALVSDREDVAGDLTVRWESDRDGILHEAAPDSTGVSQFIARDLAAGDHVLTVTVTDSTGLTATTLGTFTVNGIPGAAGISLTPSTPYTDDDLVVRIDTPAVDPEGDPLTYTYAWTRDGVASTASTSATLPASATTDGEIWAVEVSASDGLASGPLARASVTIANSVPSLTGVNLTPDPARRGDTLTCTASGFSDADGDPDLTTYAWTVNGVTAGTGATLTGPFLVGALVACTATPNDGKDTGASVRDSVTIENTVPVVSSVTLTPTTTYTNDTLTANAVSSDPDGDTVTLRYRWFADGVEIAGATGSSLSGALAGSFDRDDVVTVEVTPNDGVTDGASVVSAGVPVRNTAPTAPTIAITPASPEAGDDLTCSVVTPATDVDGDTVSYTFAWDQDGASYASGTSGATTSVVAGADVGGGETWVCEVTAGDGTGTSGVVTAGVTVSQENVQVRVYMDDGLIGTTTGPLWSTIATVSGYPRFALIANSFYSSAGGAMIDDASASELVSGRTIWSDAFGSSANWATASGGCCGSTSITGGAGITYSDYGQFIWRGSAAPYRGTRYDWRVYVSSETGRIEFVLFNNTYATSPPSASTYFCVVNMSHSTAMCEGVGGATGCPDIKIEGPCVGSTPVHDTYSTPAVGWHDISVEID